MPAAVLQPAPVRTNSRGALRTNSSRVDSVPGPDMALDYMLRGPMTSSPNDLWQTTSNRLWKTLTPEEKSLAAAEMVKDPTPLIKASVIAVVADARKMRPVAAKKL